MPLKDNEGIAMWIPKTKGFIMGPRQQSTIWEDEGTVNPVCVTHKDGERLPHGSPKAQWPVASPREEAPVREGLCAVDPMSMFDDGKEIE
jgi:hypothetical protein